MTSSPGAGCPTHSRSLRMSGCRHHREVASSCSQHVKQYVTSYHRTVVIIREGTIRPQRPHIRTERECVGHPATPFQERTVGTTIECGSGGCTLGRHRRDSGWQVGALVPLTIWMLIGYGLYREAGLVAGAVLIGCMLVIIGLARLVDRLRDRDRFSQGADAPETERDRLDHERLYNSHTDAASGRT